MVWQYRTQKAPFRPPGSKPSGPAAAHLWEGRDASILEQPLRCVEIICACLHAEVGQHACSRVLHLQCTYSHCLHQLQLAFPPIMNRLPFKGLEGPGAASVRISKQALQGLHDTLDSSQHMPCAGLASTSTLPAVDGAFHSMALKFLQPSLSMSQCLQCAVSCLILTALCGTARPGPSDG